MAFLRRTSSAAAGTALLLTLPRVAHAGPPEVIGWLAFHPSDPNTLAIRYDNALGGMLFSDDGAKTVRVLPGTTFARSGVRSDAPMVLTGSGTVLLGGTDGLVTMDAHGCGASTLIANVWVTAIALHPSEPTTAFFVTSHASTMLRTGLWQRDAKAAVTPLGSDDSQGDGASFSPTGLRVVTMGAGLRFYETGTRTSVGDAGQTSASALRFSDDQGQTWTEHAIDASFGAGAPRLLAVNPANPRQVVVALTVGGTPDPIDAVLITDDEGATFRSYVDGVTSVGQTEVAADGRFWLADIGDSTVAAPSGGLWTASHVGDAPERVLSGTAVLSLATHPTRGTLWLGETYALTEFNPNTRTSCRLFDMSDAVGFVECARQDFALNFAAKQQLCGGWCGALHFAEAPLCTAYNDPTGICGTAAAAYDKSVGWTDPAGDAVRCAADVSSVDAATPSVPDAGTVMPVDGLDASVDAAIAPAHHDDGGCTASPGRKNGAWASLMVALAALVARRRTKARA